MTEQEKTDRMHFALTFHAILLKAAKGSTRSAAYMAKAAVAHADALLEALRDP